MGASKKSKKNLKKQLSPKQYKRYKKLNKALNNQDPRVEDRLAEILRPEDGEYIRAKIRELNRSDIFADPVFATREADALTDRFKSAIERLPIAERIKAYNVVQGSELLGYEPAGSMLRRLYPNTFSVYAFVGDNYWSAVRSRREVRVEVMNDEYEFITLDTTSRRKIKIVWQALNDMGLLKLRADMVDHLNLFGNCWLQPKRNILGGLTTFELMLPERITVVWDKRDNDQIEGFKYRTNNTEIFFPKDDIVHLKTYSTRSNSLGAPSLGSVIVDIEAAIFAALFNATVFQKGGMIGSIVSLKTQENNQIVNENNYNLLAEAVQAKFEKRYAGVRGAGQMLISPYVDKVFKLMSIGEMDGSWKNLTEATDRKVSQLLCCAPEKIGIPMTSQYQDKGLVADRIAESFDNNVYMLSTIVDDFINTVIVNLLGITDVKIRSGGAYKANSVAAGQYGESMAKIGAMTLDEYRVDILKRDPWGGELGRRILGQIVLKEGDQRVIELGPPLPDYQFAGAKRLVKHYPKQIAFY